MKMNSMQRALLLAVFFSGACVTSLVFVGIWVISGEWIGALISSAFALIAFFLMRMSLKILEDLKKSILLLDNGKVHIPKGGY